MEAEKCEKCNKPMEVGAGKLCIPCYVSKEMSWIFR